MKPYGMPNKKRYNYVDIHPKRLGRNVINWWEGLGHINKKRDRRLGREDIEKQLNH